MESYRMTQDERVALITGANRGIGLEIARELASRGNSIVLGSRDLSRGKIAGKSIASKSGTVMASELDVTDQDSIDRTFQTIKSNFSRLDILVNNAGILIDETDLPSKTNPDTMRTTFETNVFGPLRLCQAAIPLMKQNNYGRIVNVSSSAGALGGMAEALYSPAYSLSKASLNALTIILSTEMRGTNILVNSMCPGWVRTDMGGPNAPRSVQQGADTAVWLATLPDDGPTGGYFRDRKRIEW
jgi:NAD(P)-dependent dehydrogenase (short-subunit alcohol dehydrogenase family)